MYVSFLISWFVAVCIFYIHIFKKIVSHPCPNQVSFLAYITEYAYNPQLNRTRCAIRTCSNSLYNSKWLNRASLILFSWKSFQAFEYSSKDQTASRAQIYSWYKSMKLMDITKRFLWCSLLFIVEQILHFLFHTIFSRSTVNLEKYKN